MADDGGTRAKSGKLAALQMLQQVAARARKLSLGELAFSQWWPWLLVITGYNWDYTFYKIINGVMTGISGHDCSGFLIQDKDSFSSNKK